MGSFLLAMNNFGEENLCQSGRRDSGTCCDRGLAQRKKEEREKAATVPQSEAAEKGNKMLLPRMIAGIALVIIVALYISHLR